MDIEQKLGVKVFYYYLSKRISVGLIVLIISIVFYSSESTLISKIIAVVPKNLATEAIGYCGIGLFLISALTILGAFIMSWINYIDCTFVLGENAFSIRRGLFSKKEVSIPYRQIQNINIERSFYFKTMGVSKLIVLTAGNDNNDTDGGSEGIFQVIDSAVAEKLKEDLLEKIS